MYSIDDRRLIVKRLLGLLVAGLIGWLVLSGCAPTDNLAKAGPTKEPTVAPETTQSPAARVPQIVGKDTSMYPPQNLSLVASTGRPQLLNSYADWCTTCQHNHPLVDALAKQFEGKVDLVSLNIDVAETKAVRDEFNITDRSQYVFIDAKGNIIQRWYGFLDDTNITQTIQDYLAKNA
jgi:thiol:disulfide interchange protein